MRTFFILIIVLILICNSSYCQQIEEPENNKSQQELYDYHILKKKHNQNTAWVLLGSGLGLIVFEAIKKDPETNNIAEAVAQDVAKDATLIIGGVLAASSIPFFIISNNHRNKANLALMGGTISHSKEHISQSSYIGLSLTIPISN